MATEQHSRKRQREYVDEKVKHFKKDHTPQIYERLKESIPPNAELDQKITDGLTELVALACEQLPESEFKQFQTNLEQQESKLPKFKVFENGNCAWIGQFTYGCSFGEWVFFSSEDSKSVTLDSLECKTLEQLRIKHTEYKGVEFCWSVKGMRFAFDVVSEWAEEAGAHVMSWYDEMQLIHKYMIEAKCSCK